MKDIFNQEVVSETIERINKIQSDTQPEWGTMNSGQMFAHLNVAYDMAFTDKYPKPKGFKKFMIKLFAKKMVTGTKPYPKNGRTAPQFIISDEKEIQVEREKLINYLNQVKDLGRDQFEQKESHSFGPLSAEEWNNLFYKHLNHHLTQFGV